MPKQETTAMLNTRILASGRIILGAIAFISPRHISQLISLPHTSQLNFITRLFGVYDCMFGLVQWRSVTALGGQSKPSTKEVAQQTLRHVLAVGIAVDLIHTLAAVMCYMEGSLDYKSSAVGGALAFISAVSGLGSLVGV